MKIPIPKFLEDLAIISKLGDNPGADNGLTSNALKSKFDEAGLKIQKYINSLVDILNTELADNGPIFTAVANANNAASNANSAAEKATNAAAAAADAAAIANAAAKFTVGYDEGGLYVVTE